MGSMRPEEAGTAVAVAASQSSEVFDLFHPQTFQKVWSIATALADCDLLPKAYHLKPANVLIAMEVARVMRMSLLQVTQNLQVIDGKPGWSAQFIIGAINATRRFSPLEFEYEDLGVKSIAYAVLVWVPREQKKLPEPRTTEPMRDRRCRAVATDTSGRVHKGPWVSVEVAVKEGWYFRNGSKWPTLEEVMLAYRAASFFGKLYAPEITLGLLTDEELGDIGGESVARNGALHPEADLATRIRAQAAHTVDAATGELRSMDGATITLPTEPARSTSDANAEVKAAIEAVTDAPTLTAAIAAFKAASSEQRTKVEKLLPARVEEVLTAMSGEATPELTAVMTAVYECANSLVSSKPVQNALNAAYKRKYEDVKGGA